MSYFFILFTLLATPLYADSVSEINQKRWIHGTEDCSSNQDPAIDVLKYSKSTYILRQNKCLNYEAPFIYVLFGTDTVFIQDTGATAEAELFPLYETIQKLINERREGNSDNELNMLVTHSHSHGDHTAADQQFLGKANVTLIEPNAESVQQYFAFNNWPEGNATIDLGGRELSVIPIPGHQDESIAIYDAETQWLLTGDTFYPGRLYIKDWTLYRSSIRRLIDFSKTQNISAVLGTHIEMTNVPKKDYPIGTTYQPEEAGLALTVDDLMLLDSALSETGSKAKEKVMSNFIISPIGAMQRYVGGFLGWVKRKIK